MRRTTLLTALALLLAPASLQAQWAKKYSIFGDGNNLAGVAAGTADNAVAVGALSDGQGGTKPGLLYTIDRGENWAEAPAPGQFSLIISVSMPDANTVYGAGLGLYKSTSGGSSYAAVSIPGTSLFTGFTQVDAFSAAHAAAVSGSDVYRTHSGQAWDATKTGMDAELNAVFMLDAGRLWIAGGKVENITETDPYTGEEVIVDVNVLPNGLVMSSTDGGKTFEPLVMGAPEVYYHLAFANELIGLAVCGSETEDYYLKRTTDGGKTWSQKALPPAPNGQPYVYVTRPVFISMFEAWIAGSAGTPEGGFGNQAVILHSLDGGVSWESDPTGQESGFYYDIDFAGPHWGFAVGDFAKIMVYNDGTPWVPPVDTAEAQDVVTQPDGTAPDAAEPDVFSWGSVFGTFGTDVLVSPSSYPGADGGPLVIGADTGCYEVKSGSGCAVGDRSTGGPGLLVLLGAAVLWLRRRNSRTDPRYRAEALCLPRRKPFAINPCPRFAAQLALSNERLRPWLAGGLVEERRGRHWLGRITFCTLFVLSCGSEKTETVCPDTCQGLPVGDMATPDGTGDMTGDSPTHAGGFSCTLDPGEAPLAFQPGPGRRADRNNYLVFVKRSPDGGSDLWLASPDGTETAPLTRFADPAVEVSTPAWSPDRTVVAFAATYRGLFNEYRSNVFLVALDQSACYQVTPTIEDARIRTKADLTATVTGAFKYGQGAVAAPIPNATVAFPGAASTVLTGSGGEFSLEVPPGQGMIVMRGTYNGMQVQGTAAYDVEPGKTAALPPTIGFVEADRKIPSLAWAFDGMTLYAFINEKVQYLAAIDANTGESAPYLEKENDQVAAFAPFPDERSAVVSFNSHPEDYFVYYLDDTPKVVHEFPFEGQAAAATVAMSPLRMLATVQDDRLKLLGAAADGTIAIQDVTPANVSGLQPGQLDWSLDGSHVVVAVSSGAKTNLLVIDVNLKQGVALTTDGLASMPAWFGR